jgi:hypothetical protein
LSGANGVGVRDAAEGAGSREAGLPIQREDGGGEDALDLPD